MNTMTNAPTIEQATRAIASVCDGAVTEDAQGFNGTDTKFGNRAAALPDSAWTDGMRREAWEMLRKYRGQLASFGIDYDAIPEPPAVDTHEQREARQDARRRLRQVERNKATTGSEALYTISLENGRLVFAFPYEPTLVDVMRALPSRTFNGQTKNWEAPVTPANAAYIADENALDAFQWTDEARAALAGMEAKDPRRVERMGDGSFAVFFPKDWTIIERVREIPGRRFEDDPPRWTVPATGPAARALLDVIDEFGFTTDQREALAEIVTEDARAIVASRAEDADFEMPDLPDGLAPLPFQRAGVKYVVEHAEGRAILGDDTGLGKTVEMILVLLSMDAFPALVACPATVKLQIRDEVRKWAPHLSVEVLDGQTPPDSPTTADVVVINYAILHHHAEHLAEREWAAVVGDEIHNVKNKKAKRTKALARLMAGARVRLGMSATALRNRPIELVEPLKMLDRLKDLGGFWQFARRYCGATNNGYGWDFNGATNIEELGDRLRATCFVRRKKDDVLAELPPERRTPVRLGIDLDAYKRAEKDAWNNADLNSAATATNAGAYPIQLAAVNSLRQAVARLKQAAVVDWVRSTLTDTGEKVVVFAHHQEQVRALAKRFGAVATIIGGMGSQKKADAVAAFEAAEPGAVIVISTQAGGEGLDGLHRAASHAVFAELEWSPGDLIQAEGRIRRIGGRDAASINYWYLLADGPTIDGDMWGTTIEPKWRVVEAVLDGTAPAGDAPTEREAVQVVLDRIRERAEAA